MLKLDLIKESLIIAITLSTITCAIVQKTKTLFKSSKYISLYSFIINIITSIIFCMSFTNVKFPNSMWIGLFSFLEADTLYKTLEGKLESFTMIRDKKMIQIPKKNIINEEEQ